MTGSLHSTDYQLFRSMLIEARVASGLTQMQIAEHLSKPQSYISKYERGEKRLDFPEFVELAEILEIDVVAFVKDYQETLAASKAQKMRKPKKAVKS